MSSRARIAVAARAVVATCLVGAPLALLPTPAGAANLTLVVNYTASDSPDFNLGDGVCDAVSGTAGSQCTLRAAIQNANIDATVDYITFAISGSGVRTISPTSALPTITGPVEIDGWSQLGSVPNSAAVGSNAVPLVQLSGTNAGVGTSGLTVTAGYVTIAGLVINRFSGRGLHLMSGTLINVDGCFIGVDPSGTIDVGNGAAGIEISSNAARIGGNQLSERNVISGNGAAGIHVTSVASDADVINSYIGVNAAGTADVGNTGPGIRVVGAPQVGIGYSSGPTYRNVISGNDEQGIRLESGQTAAAIGNSYIGLNAAGTAAIANAAGGVYVNGGQGISFGRDSAKAGNVVAGNVGHGVHITSTSTPNVLTGNLVGTNATGTAAVPNTLVGVFLDGTSGDRVGGVTPAERNVLSGNGRDGLSLFSSDDATVHGNHVGTNLRATATIPNGESGVFVAGDRNRIGGPGSGERNIISGNAQFGVETFALATDNLVQGNYIGTDASGTVDLGNSHGVYISSYGNTIGGPGQGEGNVISGNTIGVWLRQGGGAVIQGNRIGTDATGTRDLGNSSDGVFVDSADNLIGGTVPGAGNVISGNTRFGIWVEDADADRNTIQGNLIGTASDGSSPLGNSSSGVRTSLDVEGTLVGGDPLFPNVIAFNDGDGVEVFGGTGQTVTHNSIRANNGLGIDLGASGVTPNDAGDGDTGPNGLQNAPVITAVSFTGGEVVVTGSLNSTPSSTFQIHVYADVENEAATYVGTATAVTDASGNDEWLLRTPAIAADQFVTATATDAAGSTSELSPPFATPPTPTIAIGGASIQEGDGGTSNLVFVVSLTNAAGRQVTVDYATAGDTARSSVDFVARAGTLTFPSGVTSRTISVAVAGDLLDEDTETFLVNLSNVTNAVMVDNEALGTIIDNDAAPTVTVTDVAVDELDTATSASFTVSLSAPSGKSIEVDYATGDGTAVAGTDYTARSGTLLFKPGATSRRVSVSVAGDNATEAAETFQLLLSDAVEATIADGVGVATIADDDTEPPPSVTVSVNDASIVESDASLVYVTFTIRLSQASASPVSVDIATADITAIANVDYRPRTLTVSIPAGTTSVTRQIAVNPDTTVEGNETFALNVSNPVGVTIADAQGIGTIIDDADG